MREATLSAGLRSDPLLKCSVHGLPSRRAPGRGNGRTADSSTSASGSQCCDRRTARSGHFWSCYGSTARSSRRCYGSTAGSSGRCDGSTASSGRRCNGHTAGGGWRFNSSAAGGGRRCDGSAAGCGQRCDGSTASNGRRRNGSAAGSGRRCDRRTAGRGRRSDRNPADSCRTCCCVWCFESDGRHGSTAVTFRHTIHRRLHPSIWKLMRHKRRH